MIPETVKNFSHSRFINHRERRVKMRNRMVLVILAVSFAAASVLAHPPKRVELDFEIDEHLLKIRIDHEVKDIKSHYIEEIHVKLNDDVVIQQKFTSQQGEDHQEAIYMMTDAELKDKVTVIVYCSISGKKSRTIEIEKGSEEETEEKTEEKTKEKTE
jgi:desulfoferrodoxin (superoxide reductase-like protein)